MVTKNSSNNGTMAVKLKEIKRTYEITLEGGGILFKYMTPTEMNKIKTNKSDPRLRKWKKISLVGNPDKHIKLDPKPAIQKDLSFNDANWKPWRNWH